MPCYSVIRTMITNGDHLITALKELGYNVETNAQGDVFATLEIAGQTYRKVFEKGTTTFSVRGFTTNLAAITRKYSEVGVRSWARQRGFSVVGRTETNGQIQIKLVNRRG